MKVRARIEYHHGDSWPYKIRTWAVVEDGYPQNLNDGFRGLCDLRGHVKYAWRWPAAVLPFVRDSSSEVWSPIFEIPDYDGPFVEWDEILAAD